MHALRTLTIVATTLSLSALAFAQNTDAKSKSKQKARVTTAEIVKAPVVPMPADGEQLMAAALTLFGAYQCEYSQSVTVTRNAAYDGYVNVAFGKQTWTMKPVRSMTGALRLEEVSGDMLMVQIPTKSMLMDTRQGRRVVDSCKHEDQLKEADADNSLGINAPGQMALGGTPAVAAKSAR